MINVKKNQIPKVIAYNFLPLPKEFSEEFFKYLKNDIALFFQGEPVEVSEDNEIAILLLFFDIAHRVSPEMVLRMRDGKRFLIFNHQCVKVIRPKDILESFAKEEEAEIMLKNPVKSLDIDIDKIWRANKKIGDYSQRISRSLKDLKKKIKPNEATTLIGEESPMLLLLVFHMLYGLAGEVWYQAKKSDKSIKIR